MRRQAKQTKVKLLQSSTAACKGKCGSVRCVVYVQSSYRDTLKLGILHLKRPLETVQIATKKRIPVVT